jgi:hypothetical protein
MENPVIDHEVLLVKSKLKALLSRAENLERGLILLDDAKKQQQK